MIIRKGKSRKEKTCPHCMNVWEYDDDDIEELDIEDEDSEYAHIYGFVCPYCKKNIIVQEMNCTFPDTFYDFTEGKMICKDEIQDWIEEILETFKEDSSIQYAYRARGNSMVMGYLVNDGENIEIDVIRQYYSDTVPRK